MVAIVPAYLRGASAIISHVPTVMSAMYPHLVPKQLSWNSKPKRVEYRWRVVVPRTQKCINQPSGYERKKIRKILI